MIARVVPITRIRRDTDSWSYKLPAGSHVLPGALVVIPFSGRECLGVVWEIDETDEKASKSVTKVLCPDPLVKAPQRRFIEYLSQTGLCSLSTALYVWMPRALRRFPLPSVTRQLVAGYVSVENPAAQHCILVPGKRPEQEAQLTEKFGKSFSRMYSDISEPEEIIDWFRVLRGEIRVGLGRERTLFAPWSNLRNLTLIEPEDIFYYHEQIPYLSLSEAAWELARLTNAQTAVRTYLPTSCGILLWPDVEGQDNQPAALQFIDLHKEPIVSDTLLEAIRSTVIAGKRVVLLYNAHDRVREKTKDGIAGSVLVPGIESFSRQIAKALGRETLEPDVILGTRSIFDTNYTDVGLAIVVSLDPLIDSVSFADQLHGLSDLGHLFSYACPVIVQCYRQEHPLAMALRNGTLETYIANLISEHKELSLPPFGQQIVLTHPDRSVVLAACEKLNSLVAEPWQLGHPLLADWHNKGLWHIILQSQEPRARIPAAVRKLIISLPSPWKVLRNPGHLM